MGVPVNCIIVEDEPLAQEKMRDYIEKLSFLHLSAVFDNGLDALVYLKTYPLDIDLVFLDINMGEFSGIRLLEAGMLSCQVIIITAYDQYALKGYELNVADYLLKPYTFERFLQAVEKVRNNLSRQTLLAVEKKFIFIRTEHRLEKLMLSDVLYIEGMRDYRKIHTAGKPIMTLQTFGELEDEIHPGIVCRVHKSFMVALDKIESIERDQIRIRDRMIPISDTYKKAFYEWINHPAANPRK